MDLGGKLQLYFQTDKNNINSAIALLNDNLTRIYNWSKSYGIAVNPSKCQAIVLCGSRLLSQLP